MSEIQPTRRQNIEQERGRQAWKNVKAIKDLNQPELEKKYRSQARGLNAMIQMNGLGQTLGFLNAKHKNAKGKTEHYYLMAHLTEWMKEHFTADNSGEMTSNHNGLLTWVINEATTSADYRRATTECLAFGLWLRRFAEAELKDDGEK